MAKPPTSVRSIRLPDTVWAALSAEAERRKLSVNALVAEALASPIEMPLSAKVVDLGAGDATPLKVKGVVSKPKRIKSRLKGEWKAP